MKEVASAASTAGVGLGTAKAVADLAGPGASRSTTGGLTYVVQALAAIDRLEVRGRDSAGLHLFVYDHGLRLDDGPVAVAVARRAPGPLYQAGSVRVADGALSFVYKAAAEIGELGDNTAAMRDQIRADGLLRLALEQTASRVAVLGHTRWASVGIISEPNAHPVNSDELELGGEELATRPFVVAALNGDVDNHADLRALHHLQVAGPITTARHS